MLEQTLDVWRSKRSELYSTRAARPLGSVADDERQIEFGGIGGNVQ